MDGNTFQTVLVIPPSPPPSFLSRGGEGKGQGPPGKKVTATLPGTPPRAGGGIY